MRLRHVATTVAAVTAGLTAAAALRERAERRASVRVPAPAPIHVEATIHVEASAEATGGVVLPFVRPAAAAPVSQDPSTPARCGDDGGRTKAGAPCAARATAGRRCHHHRIAA
jgi:hypothetical protein